MHNQSVADPGHIETAPTSYSQQILQPPTIPELDIHSRIVPGPQVLRPQSAIARHHPTGNRFRLTAEQRQQLCLLFPDSFQNLVTDAACHDTAADSPANGSDKHATLTKPFQKFQPTHTKTS